MKKLKTINDEFNPYCSECGTCGFIGCCGIREFLRIHVMGKTNCDHEEAILADIITRINETIPADWMHEEYLKKCWKCKKLTCAGWHKVDKKKKPQAEEDPLTLY